MVRSVAERAFVPARHVLEEFGDMMILTGRTIWSALRPPYPYGGELVSQFLFALRLCWFPLLVSTVCICYAAPGLQAANSSLHPTWYQPLGIVADAINRVPFIAGVIRWIARSRTGGVS